MALSFKSYPADGTQTDFQVTFDYLDESHVRVRVDKTFTDEVGSGYKFEWINSTTIRVTTVIDSNPAPAGTQIELIRRTPIDTPAVIFGGGAALTSANLNKNSEYLTYALQEATDANEEFTKLYLGSFDTAPTSDNDGDTLQVGAVYYDSVIKALFYWTGDGWIIGESTFAAETARVAAEAAQVAAESAATNAQLSETNASSSASQANQSAVTASSAKDAAESAKTASEAARDTAQGYASTASSAQIAAESARDSAQSDAASAQVDKNAAQVAASNAASSASAASTSESNAATSATEADSHRANAVIAKDAAEVARNAAQASAAAAATFEPALFTKYADDRLPTSWVASQTEAEAGSDDAKGMTPLKVHQYVEERMHGFRFTGGDASDIGLSDSLRLSGLVTATASTAWVVATYYIHHAVVDGNDFVGTVKLYDMTDGVVMSEYSIIESTAGSIVQGSVSCALPIVRGGLIVGRTYRVELHLRKSVANGPSIPYQMAIAGFFL